MKTFVISVVATVLGAAWVSLGSAIERKISIFNNSGTKIEVYWIHPQTKQTLLQSDPFIYNGATFNLNSFVDHSFEAREMAGKSGKCGGKDHVCRVAYFAVNDNEDQAVYIDDKFKLKHQDNKSIARESASELINDCETDVLEDIHDNDDLTTVDAIAQLKTCIETGVALEMERANEEIAFQKNIRHGMAEHYENYTCADYGMETSEPDKEVTWIDEKDLDEETMVHEVLVMLDRPTSKVHIVKNFITQEECDAMEKEAEPRLHKATVADGKGGSELSPNRKAQQAGIRIPWHKESNVPPHPLTTISRRVYDYTNHVLGMGIDEHGQEDLMSIQYFGRGLNDTEPDRYTPHCDGDCDGKDFKPGNRMATMVMYCKVPEQGGATNFRNAGVHVVPEVGTATFFAYIDPSNLKMDNGLTEHSGCPVIEGEKKIVTQWVRYGVDRANPWDSFNTLGIKISSEED
jgi:hypothetical protein